ncbi:glycosyl hydrolase family 18 protein [Silvibacterium acidisoli]|uniref:glycosyl hydrolase family 18 protein n=1 Tax=Acidobacteriaceae bacterium ZG23-2 TaxID=2883246 RepID=UPI00406C4E3A
MRIRSLCLSVFSVLLSVVPLHAQGTVPTFKYKTYTLMGGDPSKGDTTTVPTVLVPIRLNFEGQQVNGKPLVMDAFDDVARLLASPVFSRFAFPAGGNTQYADALLRSTFPAAKNWHVLLGKPEIKPITVTIPAGYGYVLTSKSEQKSISVLALRFVQKEIFKQLPKQDGKLVIALTPNATFFADDDDTICCTWGTHGVDRATGNSFVLSTYLHDAPSIIQDQDVQPVTQQLAEFVNDPLHDPLYEENQQGGPGNVVPNWLRPATMKPGDMGRCGGTGIATAYFVMEPTDISPKNNFPASKPFVMTRQGAPYHVQNVATLPWYVGASEGTGKTYSFPETSLYTQPATPCPGGRHRHDTATAPSTVPPAPLKGAPNGHELIGYWQNGGYAEQIAHNSPQWDVYIVAFSGPAPNAPEGTMKFDTPRDMTDAQFKAQIAELHKQGKKVLISLGGGGVHFSLNDAKQVPVFVSTVSKIVSDYGFDGVDIDFESPSLDVAPGDADFRHPKTPSIVNVIAGLHQMHDHFGSKFMITLVPEGSQAPGGYPRYGGQFGSYLALSYGLRDILSFMDVQDYNTPPLQGLDGEIYQSHTTDYHAAMTELILQGFNVGGDPKLPYPGLSADKVAVGFLTDYEDPKGATEAMAYLITGKAPAGVKYKLRNPNGYPKLLGAMFWNMDDDRRENYRYSNVMGPLLHGYPAAK